ncbi:hypothetical protein P7C71_g4573, partial [Lecanoromycetidae sp. Uapishka_2]
MPYLPDAKSFLEQSTLLISARPTTTRITTKYKLPKKPKTSTSDPKPTSSQPPSSSEPSRSHQPQPPTATLTLKTYDPVSGTCLKYQTDKAAEVGRLIAALGNCGRVMAALPPKAEGADEMALDVDAPVKEEPEGKAKEAKKEVVKTGQGQAKGGEKGGGGGGGGKKKKGKR